MEFLTVTSRLAFVMSVIATACNALCDSDQFACPNSGRCIARTFVDGREQLSNEDTCVCHGELRKHFRGTITSPYRPSYPGKVAIPSCLEWKLESSSSKDIITISISDLDIRTKSANGGSVRNCISSQDYLMIRSQPHGDLFYCNLSNASLPIVFISNASVSIHYYSSGMVAERGFELQYIRGPMYRGKTCSSDEAKCRNGKCILSKWLCNGANECEDASDEENCPPQGVCGPNEFSCLSLKTHALACLPEIQLCDGFRQCLDGYDEGPGCHLNRTCGHTFGGYTGVINSPNFPYYYPNNLHCRYYIQVETDRTMQLRFITFELEEMADTDLIKVYDGKDESSAVLGVYSMSSFPPRVLESTGNQLTIVLITDREGQSFGFNATYQVKGYCLVGLQLQCSHGENDCYDTHQRCDGNWDCPMHGGDERGCAPCTSTKDMYPCGSTDSQCFRESDRCNGKGHCSNRQDEVNCLPAQCGPHNGTFLCMNRQCVLENWVCDGANDCGDNSDEIGCPLSTKVIIAAVIGSLTCSLLLVVALGCTCKLHTLRLREQSGLGSPRYISPLTQVQDEIFARRAAPPPYLEAMRISRNFDEVQREILTARQAALEAAETSDRQTQATLSSDDEELIDISTEQQDASSASREPESSDVQISVEMGITAQWRRNRPRRVPKPGEEEASCAEDPGDTASGSNELIILDKVTDEQMQRSESLDSMLSDVRNMETIVAPPDPVIQMDSGPESIPPDDDDDVPLLDQEHCRM